VVEADIERYMAEGLAIDNAEDTLYGKKRTGQELPREVKQALEKREGIVVAIKEIQEIKENDKTGKKEPKINPLETRFMRHKGGRIRLKLQKIVEPVFGQVKFNLGFRRFRLRGSDKADGEWTLVCLVHNIKKIYARIMAKGGEPDGLTGELQAAYNLA